MAVDFSDLIILCCNIYIYIYLFVAYALLCFPFTSLKQDFQEKRLLMSFVNFHEQEKISKKTVTEAIEDCMKKQADNLLQSLDVISGRLSQLELYCYKLERSIGELRSDVMDYHGEANLNFSCLEKNVIEVCPVLYSNVNEQSFIIKYQILHFILFELCSLVH
jgi:hypothetical protein